MADLLTAALLSALEPEIRRIASDAVRAELATMKTTPAADWLTPPALAKARGLSLKRVRSLMASGVLDVRPKSIGAQHPKFEIRAASLDAALAGQEQSRPVAASSWAAARAAKRGAA